MEFIYFVPGGGVRPATWPASLRQRLGPAAATRETQRGPGAEAGVLLAASADVLTRVADPCDPWQWTPAPDAALPERYSIGHDPSAMPTPADLQRAEIIDGYTPQLNDGRAWTVPLARAYPTGGNIPRLIEWTPEGPREAANPQYQAICTDAEAVWSVVQDPDSGELTTAEAARIALAALAVNYRIGPGEATVLQLLTTDAVKLVCWCLVDMPGYLQATAPEMLTAAAKKNSTAVPAETAATPRSGGAG